MSKKCGEKLQTRSDEMLTRPSPECEPSSDPDYTRYYDSPDGYDVDKKIAVTARYGAVVGLVCGTYDALMYSHAVGIPQILQRYASHIIPWAGMGALFSVVANGMLHYRQKDDAWNYFAGGAVCGPFMTYYLSRPFKDRRFVVAAVPPVSLLLGLTAVIKKWGVDEGWTFFPDVNSHQGTVNSWRHDYTVAKDPGVPICR